MEVVLRITNSDFSQEVSQPYASWKCSMHRHMAWRDEREEANNSESLVASTIETLIVERSELR